MDLKQQYYVTALFPVGAIIQTTVKFTLNCTETQNFDDVVSYPPSPLAEKLIYLRSPVSDAREKKLAHAGVVLIKSLQDASLLKIKIDIHLLGQRFEPMPLVQSKGIIYPTPTTTNFQDKNNQKMHIVFKDIVFYYAKQKLNKISHYF